MDEPESDRVAEEIDLDAFLAGLPPEAAAAARAAAERIDALERQIGPPGWIERHLGRLCAIALGLFVAGLLLLVLAALRGAGAALLAPAMLLLAAFPMLVFAYLWSVRRRTALDREKMALNERHFLPWGGVYYGAHGARRLVLRVARRAEEPTLRERAERLHAQATRRRWWW